MADAITRPRRRSLTRVGGLVVIFLAFGAVINFGVAWWCVRGFEREKGAPGPGTTGQQVLVPGSVRPKKVVALARVWTVDVPPDWPSPTMVLSAELGRLQMTSENFFGLTDPRSRFCRVHHTEVGWPLRCWWGAVRSLRSPHDTPTDTEMPLHCLEVPEMMRGLLGVGQLPIGIHPLPFIANTLVYAAIPFALWLAVGPVRRWRRRRAGRCTVCGYDRAGIAAEAKCPECGAGGASERAASNESRTK